MLDQQTPQQVTEDTQPGTSPTEKAKRWESTGVVAKTQRDLASTMWRLRRQMVPHLTAAGIGGAGLAAHSIAASGGMPPSALALAAAAGGGLTSLAAWKAVLQRRPRWAKRALAAGAFASAWLATTPFGVTVEQVATLLAADFAFGAAWWKANRLGYPRPEVVQESTEEDLSEVDQTVADWEEYNACNGGPLPNSRLVNPQILPHTISFDLEFWRGRQTLSTAFAALEKIAGGLDRDVDEIILEGFPKTPGQRGSASRARFQVITDSPIAGAVNFTGPRRHDGFLDMGPFADGAGEASWRLYTPGSMWSGMIIGGTGIGKSRLVENLGISALSGGDTIIIYVDPQGGVSSPALAEHAHLFIPGANIDLLLDALLAGIEARGEENAAEGWTGFTPLPERPGILVIVEECHRPFADKDTASNASYVAREGRKVGFALLAISQYPGLVTFGNNEALRSSIMEGNGVVLRSTSNQTKGLMPGMDVDPKTLPRIPGYAYVLGSTENGQRTAPFRNRDTGNDSEVTGAWLAAQPAPQMDDLLANAIARSHGGILFRDVGDTAQSRKELTRARVEAMRNGLDPDEVAPRPGFTKQEGPVAAAETEETLGEVIEFPGPLTLAQLRSEPRPRATQAPIELGDSHRAVLAAVANGAARPTEIENATGLRHRRVAELLKELVDAGHLTQPRYGRYERAA